MIARSHIGKLLLISLYALQLYASEEDIFTAIDSGDCATIEQLVKGGIRLDTLRDNAGHSVLSYAVQGVNENRVDAAVIEELVKCGAPVNVEDEDEIRIVGHQCGASHSTPLHYVARLSNQQVKDQLWKLFTAKGANVYARDAQGQSPEELKQALTPYSSELHKELSKTLEDEIFNG